MAGWPSRDAEACGPGCSVTMGTSSLCSLFPCLCIKVVTTGPLWPLPALKGLLRELLELWEVAEDQGWSSLGDWEQGPIGRSSKLIHLED